MRFFMMSLLARHAQAIQTAAALVMAAAALSAVIVVPWQIAANERSSREQSAREIYREFLSISIQRPELASQDFCTLADPVQRAAHESYVDYLLYTAEQVLDLNAEDWEAAIGARLQAQMSYLCTFHDDDFDTLTPAVALLVRQIVSDCPSTTSCNKGQP